MKKFSDFNIQTESKAFKGEKISIDRIFNREILVIDYKIEDSKFKKREDDKCLTLQIKVNDELRITFTSSSILMDKIQKVKKEDFPFSTTIVKIDKAFDFT